MMLSALRTGAPLGPAGTAAVALLATASLGITATAAWAAWSVTGTAATTAKTATAKALVLAVSPVVGLYPGAAQDVTVTVENQNEFPVTLTSLTLSATTSTAPGCAVAGNLTVAPFGAALPTIAAGATSSLVFDDGVTLSVAAPDACQGVTFSLSATANGSSAS